MAKVGDRSRVVVSLGEMAAFVRGDRTPGGNDTVRALSSVGSNGCSGRRQANADHVVMVSARAMKAEVLRTIGHLPYRVGLRTKSLHLILDDDLHAVHGCRFHSGQFHPAKPATTLAHIGSQRSLATRSPALHGADSNQIRDTSGAA